MAVQRNPRCSIATFEGAAVETFEKAVPRVNGMYWINRGLVVQKLLHSGFPPR